MTGTPFVVYSQKPIGRVGGQLTVSLNDYYAKQKEFLESLDADSEVGFVSGLTYGVGGTSVRIKEATVGFGGSAGDRTFKLTQENVKNVLDQCGGDMVMAETALKYIRREEDIPKVIDILKENKKYDQLQGSASMIDSFMSDLGKMATNPADIAMMYFGGGAVGTAYRTATGLARSGLRQVGSASLAGGVGNVISGEISQETTGIKEDAGSNLLTGAVMGGGFVGAGKYLGDLAIRSKMLRNAQLTGNQLSPNAFNGLWGNNGIAEGINNFRRAIEAKLPSVTTSGAFSWAKTDGMIKLRNKLFKVEEGIEVRKPDGTVEYKQVNVRGQTVEEQLRDVEDEIERNTNVLNDITDEISKYGVSQEELNYAVVRYLETGALPNTPYKDKVKEFGDILRTAYDDLKLKQQDRDLLGDGIDDYTPTVIDDMAREDFINKQQGSSYQEKKLNAQAAVKHALIQSAKNPRVRANLRKQFKIEKLDVENEARLQRVDEARKKHQKDLNKLQRDYKKAISNVKNSKTPSGAKQLAKKKTEFDAKKKALDDWLKDVFKKNKPITKREEEAMFKRWVNVEAQNTALGWIDKNESAKVGLMENDISITPNFRKHKTAFGYSEMVGTGFNPNSLRVGLLEAYRLYARRVGGDIIAYDTFGTKNFAETDQYLGKLLDKERNYSTGSPKEAKNHAKRVDEMKKALVHIQNRIYGRADPDTQRDLNYADAIAEMLRHFTFATSNSYMGVLNATETAEGVRAYGASFMIHSIPLAGKFIERIANKATTLEDRDMILDMIFAREVKNRRYFRDLRVDIVPDTRITSWLLW